MKQQYQDFVPKKSIPQLQSWIQQLAVIIRVVDPRRTRLGDFKVQNQKMIISINNNLNPYSFLITLTHELAHAFVYNEYKRTRSPHGRQWKLMFKSMLLNFLSPSYFPKDILDVLSLHIRNPKASTLSDIKLYAVLRKYDSNQRLVISDLNEGEEFRVNSKQIFIKGPKLRKRYRCVEKNTTRLYLFHPLTEIIAHNKNSF